MKGHSMEITDQMKTKPYDHQTDALSKSATSAFYGLFMEMGTGKSKIIVDNICYLRKNYGLEGAIIVAPKGVFMNWVYNEFPKHVWDEIEPQINMIIWSQKINRSIFRFENELRPGMLNILFMNVEAFSHNKANNICEFFVSKFPKTMMVVDESTTIKNLKSKRTKNVLQLRNKMPFRRILTGTPVTKGIEDLYTQLGFLSYSIAGYDNFYSFRNHFCELRQEYIANRTVYKITGYKNVDELLEKLEPHTTIIKKKECLTLPDKIYQYRYHGWEDEQLEIYNNIKYLFATQTGDLTITNLIAQMVKLHQVACGYYKNDDGQEISVKNKRIECLLEVIDELPSDEKITIWATYRHSVRTVKQALIDAYGEDSVVTYYGPDSTAERDHNVDRFQNGDAKFLIGTQATAGRGITLTASSSVIYFANNYNLEYRLQSEDRNHRISQECHVNYIDIMLPNSIDEAIIAALRRKKHISDLIRRTPNVLQGWMHDFETHREEFLAALDKEQTHEA